MTYVPPPGQRADAARAMAQALEHFSAYVTVFRQEQEHAPGDPLAILVCTAGRIAEATAALSLSPGTQLMTLAAATSHAISLIEGSPELALEPGQRTPFQELSESYTLFQEEVAAILGVPISDSDDPEAAILAALRKVVEPTSPDEVKAAEKLRDTIAERRGS